MRLPKSGGVVMRPPTQRKQARTARVKEYFYGARGELSPHSRTLGFSELRVYRVGGGPRAPTSALPIGAHLRYFPSFPSMQVWHGGRISTFTHSSACPLSRSCRPNTCPTYPTSKRVKTPLN